MALPPSASGAVPKRPTTAVYKAVGEDTSGNLDMRLRNKAALVTGGGSGIGRATCELFAREGAALAVLDLDPSAAETTANSVRGKREAIALNADVSDSTDLQKAIDVVIARFGRIDILVNNAGYGIRGTVVDTEEADWNRLIAVNLGGVFLACKYVIPNMRSAGGGTIVNTASAVGLAGIAKRAAYIASKGAVIALTRALAVDHADQGIRVNAVAPGPIETPYLQSVLAPGQDLGALQAGMAQRALLGRIGTADEVAHAILYLASEESSYLTGVVLPVDGGMLAR
jgi:meso-butanediol dehydrogenase/(S,S)-butanediol dehydrogenase/diacetyl reductase